MTDQEQDPTKVEKRKPLLDLSALVEQRDCVVDAQGNEHYLRTDGLGALEHHELFHALQRHDELFDKPPGELTAKEKKELEGLLDRMVEIVLDAPAEIRAQIRGDRARQLLRDFQRASQPAEVSMQQRLADAAALAEALTAQTAETETSTTES